MLLQVDHTCSLHGCVPQGHSVCNETFVWTQAIAAEVAAMFADGGNTILPQYVASLTAMLAENFPTATTT